jgi:hypothetical protein
MYLQIFVLVCAFIYLQIFDCFILPDVNAFQDERRNQHLLLKKMESSPLSTPLLQNKLAKTRMNKKKEKKKKNKK